MLLDLNHFHGAIGDKLQQIFNEVGNFQFKTINQIVKQMIDILQKLQELGYVYNDLKPDNICVDKFKDLESTL